MQCVGVMKTTNSSIPVRVGRLLIGTIEPCGAAFLARPGAEPNDFTIHAHEWAARSKLLTRWEPAPARRGR